MTETVERQKGWPSAALVGLAPLRMAAVPAPPDFENSDHWWTMMVSADEENEHLLVTGDIARVIGSWFFGVTVAGRVQIKEGVPPLGSDEEYDAALNTYGSWAAHPLWDYCRALLMQLAGPFMVDAFDVPLVTPMPRYLTSDILRRNSEQSDDEGSE